MATSPKNPFSRIFSFYDEKRKKQHISLMFGKSKEIWSEEGFRKSHGTLNLETTKSK